MTTRGSVFRPPNKVDESSGPLRTCSKGAVNGGLWHCRPVRLSARRKLPGCSAPLQGQGDRRHNMDDPQESSGPGLTITCHASVQAIC